MTRYYNVLDLRKFFEGCLGFERYCPAKKKSAEAKAQGGRRPSPHYFSFTMVEGQPQMRYKYEESDSQEDFLPPMSKPPIPVSLCIRNSMLT